MDAVRRVPVAAAALAAVCVVALVSGDAVAGGPGSPRAAGSVGGPIVWAAPAQAQRTEPGRTSRPALAPPAAHGEFARRVAIGGGRKLYLECRGTGSPTVVLGAGTGDLAKIWSLPPSGPGRAVLPAVARFTRVCAYDRPGTYLLPDVLSRSDPVAVPRSVRDIVLDLRALLRAAPIPGPYVLAGHSFGGMVARLYATTRPRAVAGLVSIDAQNEDFVAAYKELLTPEQYAAAVLNPGPPPGLELLGSRAAQPRGQRCPDAPGTSGHAAAPDAARRPLPFQDTSEPVRIPARLAGRGPGAGVSGFAGQTGRARAGSPPRDRRPKRALHPSRPTRW